jgi:hypothetical protein
MATDALLSPGQAVEGELHFYTWKKAHCPEWKSFPLWKHRKRALGNGKNFPVSTTNFCKLGAGNLQRPSKKGKIFLQCVRTDTER